MFPLVSYILKFKPSSIYFDYDMYAYSICWHFYYKCNNYVYDIFFAWITEVNSRYTEGQRVALIYYHFDKTQYMIMATGCLLYSDFVSYIKLFLYIIVKHGSFCSCFWKHKMFDNKIIIWFNDIIIYSANF